MDDLKDRVIKCFETVFPDLPRQAIPAASQAKMAEWDSIATVSLVNVLEDEFQIEMDLEKLAQLDSFDHVCENVQARLLSVNQSS